MKYEEPTIELFYLEAYDVITLSGEEDIDIDNEPIEDGDWL